LTGSHPDLHSFPTRRSSDLGAAGELDVNTAPELREQLARLVNEGVRHIVVDLAQVSFVDSTALSVLVSALKRLRQADGDLELARSEEHTSELQSRENLVCRL